MTGVRADSVGIRSGFPPAGRSPWTVGAQFLYVRWGPGMDILAGLDSILEDSSFAGITVVSAAGSLAGATYALAAVDDSGATTYSELRTVSGAIELLALSGHVGRCPDGVPARHIHATFADQNGNVLGGHLFTATALGTIEATVLACTEIGWCAHPVEHAGLTAPTHVLTPTAKG